MSSLSRARVFAYSAPSRSTIGAIVLDEAATVEEDEAGGEEYDDRVDASDGGSGKDDDDDDDDDGEATWEARKREGRTGRPIYSPRAAAEADAIASDAAAGAGGEPASRSLDAREDNDDDDDEGRRPPVALGKKFAPPGDDDDDDVGD